MQLSVKGKQLDVGAALRGHVEDMLPPAIEKYFENPTDAHVTLAKEGKTFRADIVVHVGKGITVQGHASAEDAYAAIDVATVHVSKRLRRYKRRLRDHHRGKDVKAIHMPALQYVIEPGFDVSEEAPENDQPVIVAEMETSIETLSVSEAVMRMDLSNEHALLFRNSKTDGINMVYVRSDGNVGWIDPSANEGGSAS
ncbi:MAG: ribosome-associated translation inhibitor RaiA [Rhodospirillaceae bacterium]|jgi:ribosomal subunit interface protein|nr:ribosome-associated translation inhibitor RaiA [Rhodospirillaceae bacterium]MBT5664089.1 ribosome-associated translation inhibitor RaiA [Rhodospirillaceae bacterium]